MRVQFVSHRTHYISATKTNRLMLFRETVAVCCENYCIGNTQIHCVGRMQSMLKQVVRILTTRL
jgi:hypothetical protein